MILTKFETLWEAVNHYELDKIAKTETKIFSEEGLATDLSDIFPVDSGLITVLKDGTLRKSIVYISEIKRWALDSYGYPKFHIFNCRTLVQMRNGGKVQRYKKTLRDDGKFLMIVSGEDDSQTRYISLEICGNCLSHYNTRFNRRVTKPTFNIKEYTQEPIRDSSLELKSELFKDDFESVPQFYAKNWREISDNLKKLKNYTCQKCGIKLEGAKKYLHTHHMDSNPSNNIIGNLKVLCIECHADEFNHAHIKNNPIYQEFLEYKKGLL